jgi:hypothetical protein
MARSFRCKRDALPAELSAHAPEMAGFRLFLKLGFRPIWEQSGNARHRTVLRVPKYSRTTVAAGPQDDAQPQGTHP